MEKKPEVAIISAVYDQYDSVKPALPQRDVDAEWIMVTDEPHGTDWCLAAQALGWKVVSLARPGIHPNLAAKLPKMLPWQFTTAERSIWIDASVRVVSVSFALEAMAHVDAKEPIAQFHHPSRACIYPEEVASRPLTKYAGQEMLAQVKFYAACQHPENWGLWATGIIARVHTQAVRYFGEDWLRECERFTFQDQLSEAVVLRRYGLRPGNFPGVHWQNPWLVLEPSGRH